jgi:hypothetical protein
MGLAAIAAHKIGGIIPVGAIFKASIQIGQRWMKQTSEWAQVDRPPGLYNIES